MNLQERLNTLAKMRGCNTKRALANYMEVSEQVVGNWYGGRSFPYKKILKFFPEVNPAWLITGEGDILVDVTKRAPEPEPEQLCDDGTLLSIIREKDRRIEELIRENTELRLRIREDAREQPTNVKPLNIR